MVNFLLKADHYHGIFPHWLNGETGKTIPFSRKDDGGDLVETSFLFQGLLTARQYFNKDTPKGKRVPEPHQLALERGRMELAYEGRNGPAVLALEPQSRMEHEF